MENNNIGYDNGQGRSYLAMPAIITDMTVPIDTPAGLKMGAADDLATLLEAVKAKNRDAFEAFYDATVQRVFSLAMRITQHRELAEEVVSDVYLQVWQTVESYSPERGKVIAWLSILCRSRALDTLRRNNTAVRQAAVGLDTIPELADTCEPPDLLQSVEEGTAIHAAVGQLTERQRQLVALAYFRGYTRRELATFLDMPIGTVKTNLHRAMIKLKEMMSIGAPDE